MVAEIEINITTTRLKKIEAVYVDVCAWVKFHALFKLTK